MMSMRRASIDERGGHAVVVGGSIAGLLAARVLCDHFETVTVLERDSLPAKAGPRRGVPQSHHFHVLLQRGQEILEDLFPGLRAELVAAGAALLDGARDLAWRTPAGWGVRFASPIVKLGVSRDLIEHSVRQRVVASPRIRIVDRAEVLGPVRGDGGDEVAGIRWRRPEETAPESELRAELVVDASGRGSQGPRWLAALGYERPPEVRIDARLGYASRIYRRAPGVRDWQAVFVQADPPAQPRAAVLFPVEGGRWMLSVAGGSGDFPPTDEEGFARFLHSLPSPAIADAVAAAEPLSPIVPNRSTANRLRGYERLRAQPGNLLFLGDAVCAFNPVYGQGMTLAALAAAELGRCLRRWRGRGDLARRFHRRLARIHRAPWLMTTGEDCRYRGVRGTSPTLRTRALHRYMDRVVRLTTEAAAVRRTFLEVQHMLRPPAAMFRPGILVRVLAGMAKDALRGAPPELPEPLPAPGDQAPRARATACWRVIARPSCQPPANSSAARPARSASTVRS